MRQSRSVGWRSAVRRALAFVLAMGTLYLACWIFINAPTRFWLPVSVGAPEVSAWLALGSLAAMLLSIPDARERLTGRFILGAAIMALMMSLTPLARFPFTARRFDAAMRAGLGGDPLRDVPPAVRAHMRARPLNIGELFGHVDLGVGARFARDIPFSTITATPLTMDIYRPPRPGSYPAVVQIYGGAWQRGKPADNGKFAEWLATRGYVVFAVDYRHAPGARWPAQLDDVRLALAWIRDHASEYEADTSRMALIGRSAGAHLALLAAYTDGPVPVRAVVSYYGPVDLVDAYEHPPHPDPLRIRTVEETLFGGTPGDMPDAYRAASPLTYATRVLPPTLLVHGSRDHIVELRYAVRLRDRLVATGTTAVLLDIPWADHAFDEVFNGPSSQLALYHTERFLAWAMAAPAPAVR
ncbi:MAG TPA: alpha/beta hydrolase [Gemmatimonadaceae bacterium]|nr:alpha/beta hydrolase [Gemmatimonadaceae bacterium]